MRLKRSFCNFENRIGSKLLSIAQELKFDYPVGDKGITTYLYVFEKNIDKN